MANIENLKKFQGGYEHSFALDWIENLSWKNIREATVSCDEGRRRISNFKKEAFVNLATALLEGEYIDAEDVINQLHNEMLAHWEQEHYALPVQDPHINNLKISLMREYETLDGELRYLFDQIGLLLRTVSEKLVYQSNECIFNATTYESPEELVIDYIGILSQLIIPICSFEHKLPFGINNLRDLIRIYIVLEKAINEEADDNCKALLVIARYKTAFLLKKSLPKDVKYDYYIDNNKHTISRSTLIALPYSINEHFKSFLAFSEDDTHNSDRISNIQHKCQSGTATIREYITLFDYYRKFAKQQSQIDNILDEFSTKYQNAVHDLQDGFDLYAWRTMLNYIHNCRLSYLLYRRKKKLSFEELKQAINEIDALQQDTCILNFYPYKKACEYLIQLIKKELDNREISNYQEKFELLDKLIEDYERTLNWCHSKHFYPIQLPIEFCRVEGLEIKLMLPSTFSKSIDFPKLYENLDELKRELRFLNESLQMIEQTKELNSLKDSLKASEKKYIEIGGIFVSAITFLFGTINIFTNDKATPLQMFTSIMGLGILLILFASLLVLVVNKNRLDSFKTWLCVFIVIGYTILLCFIIFGGEAFYKQLATALSFE